MKREDREGATGFMNGVLLLSASTLIVKILGLAYKIPMINILGAEGMGYFNCAYEVFALLCVISTAGLPVALSMMISSRYARRDLYAVRRVCGTAFAVFFTLGASGTLALFLFGKRIAEHIGNVGAYASIVAIAPALLCVCISGAVRGYFQGLGNMLPTALSQLTEAAGKLVFGAWFASAALKKGYDIRVASAYAVVGLCVGTLLSAILLGLMSAVSLKRLKRLESGSKKESGLAKQLFAIALPLTLGSALISLSRMVDMTLIMRRLVHIGYSPAQANELFGSYTTLALPVFGLIPSLVSPVALALVPKLCGARECKDLATQSSVLRSSMRLTTLFAIPASLGVAVYSEQILGLLFSRQQKAVSLAAPLLSVLAMSILFSCMISTTNAILQAYSHTKKPIISIAVGITVKAVSAYILIGNKNVGAFGAPISTLLCDVTVTVINLYYINKYLPHVDSVPRLYARPLAASVAMLTVSLAVFMGGTWLDVAEYISFAAAMLAALVSYLFFALTFRAIEKEDLLSLPCGKRLAHLAERSGMLESKIKKDNIF